MHSKKLVKDTDSIELYIKLIYSVIMSFLFYIINYVLSDLLIVKHRKFFGFSTLNLKLNTKDAGEIKTFSFECDIHELQQFLCTLSHLP